MLKRVLNCPEQITYRRLREVCDRRSARVYAKVRLADVLPIEGSGISRPLYEFALQSHYDFLVVDSGQMPLFAVEFDGPAHDDLAQAERDARKNLLSRRFGLPLVRLLAEDLHRSEDRLDQLTRAAERWFSDRDEKAGGPPPTSEGHAPAGSAATHPASGGPACPDCGSGMIVKDGKYGRFLSCDRFPACRGSCDLPAPSGPEPVVDRAVVGPSHPPMSRMWFLAGAIAVGAFVALSVVAVVVSTLSDSRGRQVAPAAPRDDLATTRQRNLLNLLVGRKGWDVARRDSETRRILGYSREYADLTKHEASRLITEWDDRAK